MLRVPRSTRLVSRRWLPVTPKMTGRQQWQANASKSHRTGAPYPCQRMLDGLRAGQTVNVPSYAVPGGTTLKTSPSRPGPPLMHGPRAGTPSRIYPARAIVSPGDTVAFNDDNVAELWLEENDI